MKLPDVCVLRTDRGLYLTTSGALSSRSASGMARLTVQDARRVLTCVTNRFADPMRTLSIEECPKRERRTNQPLTTADADALIATIKAGYVRARIVDLRRQAEQYEALARHDREEANRLETLANTQ